MGKTRVPVKGKCGENISKRPSEPQLREVVTGDEVKVPLLPGVRRRRDSEAPRYVPTDWDDSLPYGGKVYMARRKLPDSWPCIALQVVVLLGATAMIYWACFHTEHMHFHMTKVYAHLAGHKDAQATVGHKYLKGKGVEQNHTAAMEWFRKAAEQGHPQAAYNLAVGHMQGHRIGLQPGDAHSLIKEAAAKGVPEAVDVLERMCSHGHCDV